MNSKFCVAIVVLSVCALSLAAPQFQQQQPQPQQSQEAQVVRETNNNDGSGNYVYTWASFLAMDLLNINFIQNSVDSVLCATHRSISLMIQKQTYMYFSQIWIE